MKHPFGRERTLSFWKNDNKIHFGLLDFYGDLGGRILSLKDVSKDGPPSSDVFTGFLLTPSICANVCGFHRMKLRLKLLNFIFVIEKLPEIYLYLYGIFEDAKFINLKS